MLALLLLFIYQVKTSTIQSQAIVKEQNQDMFSIIFRISSPDKIIAVSIDLKELKCLQTSTITPINDQVEWPNSYKFDMNFQINTVSASLDQEKRVYAQWEVAFEISQFYYPTFKRDYNYEVRVNNQDIQTFYVTRDLRILNQLQIQSGSSITQEQTDLNIQFLNTYSNFPYDVIVIKFDPPYPFDLKFSSCEGIQNIGKNLNCWTKNNKIYIQQKTEDFVEKSNGNLIKFKVKDFLNAYYVGISRIEVLIQPIEYLDTTIASSNNFVDYLVKKQKNSQIILTQQNNYINSLSQIDLVIHTQRFNQYLQLEIYIPNKSSQDLIIKSNDNNMLVEVITIGNQNVQLLKLTINQPQNNYDIKLIIEKYQNFDIPTKEKCFYFLSEIFDLNNDQLKIQYGNGILNFIPNNINLIAIDTTNNYITKSGKTIIKFGIDIALQKDSLLLIKFNQNLNTTKISTLNQVINDNTLSLYGVFAEQKSEYTIEFENIINPIIPCKFNYLDLQIVYLNQVFASNQNQIEIEIIPEIITINNFNLGYLITNSHTNLNLDINFNLQHPYFTNIEFTFDESNINFNQLTKQIECNLDAVTYICQIHQSKLTIFGVKLIKTLAHLEIFYFPYPRSLLLFELFFYVFQLNQYNIFLSYIQKIQIMKHLQNIYVQPYNNQLQHQSKNLITAQSYRKHCKFIKLNLYIRENSINFKLLYNLILQNYKQYQ